MAIYFQPFIFCDNPISLTLTLTGVDYENIGDRKIQINDKPIPPDFNLNIMAQLPDDWSKVLTKKEAKASPPVELVVSITCLASRNGFTKTLKKVSKNTYSCDMKIITNEYYHEFAIKIYLVRKTSLTPSVAGYANKKFNILSVSENYSVYLEEPKDEKGEDIKTIWKKFSELPIANKHTNAVYYADLDKDPPILYMNEELPDELRQLISISSKRSKKAIARDAFISPIVADVWEQLITHALSKIKELETETLDPLDPWEQQVVRNVAKGLTYKTDLDDAIIELIDIANKEESFNDLLSSRLPLYVQEKGLIANKFNRAAQEIT